ncbi:MAG: DUF1569 domain-containing protein [Myxococcota bacterium]
MKRRRFLKQGALATGALVVGVPVVWVASGPGSSDATSAWAQSVLDDFEARGLERLQASGVWSPAQVFVHLAQSIEYSLSGYPELRSEIFRSTVGSVAFAAFSARGQLIHGRSDPIPGAPALPEAIPLEDALQRLRDAIDAFGRHTGSLHPHFAYGVLSPRDYEIAHALHLRDHLVELESV